VAITDEPRTFIDPADNQTLAPADDATALPLDSKTIKNAFEASISKNTRKSCGKRLSLGGVGRLGHEKYVI
jgi:hypothetical protein